MVAGAGHEAGKMILEQGSDYVKSSLEKKGNSATFGRGWDSGSPEASKVSDATSSPSMSSSPALIGVSSGRGHGRELPGKGSLGEAGSAFTRSSGSSTDLSSSSFKSNLSSSAYGSSQERESLGGRESGGQEREAIGDQGVSSGIAVSEKALEERKESRHLTRCKRDIMTEDPPDAVNSTEWLDAQRFEAAAGAENGGERTVMAQSGKQSENGAGKESSGDEKERGKQNAGVDSARESESARESGKVSMSRVSAGSDSNESSCSSIGYGSSKPHKANDKR
jgi:hypothetical protein